MAMLAFAEPARLHGELRDPTSKEHYSRQLIFCSQCWWLVVCVCLTLSNSFLSQRALGRKYRSNKGGVGIENIILVFLLC